MQAGGVIFILIFYSKPVRKLRSPIRSMLQICPSSVNEKNDFFIQHKKHISPGIVEYDEYHLSASSI